MAQIRAELDHLAVGIEPLAVPAHDRANGEGVAQVMDARAAPMLAEALRFAQADVLRDDGEVYRAEQSPSRRPSSLRKKRACRRPKEPYAFGAVSAKPFHRAGYDGHEARVPFLRALL